MSPENLARAISMECQRGDQALLEAEKLLSVQLVYGGVSRAYYAVFHFARALVIAAGHEPRSHAGVGHLLNMNLVRTGELDPDSSRLFAELQKYREASDYDASFVLTEAQAARVLDDARRFAVTARDWLIRKGQLVST